MKDKKWGKQVGEVSLSWFIALHLSLVVNSLAGVASKLAGRQEFLSVKFCLCYGMVLAITFAFALAWQQVLKHMSLTFAFTNKPITIIWGLIWGVVVFHETVTWKMILGSAVILFGIMIGVSGESSGSEDQAESNKAAASGQSSAAALKEAESAPGNLQESGKISKGGV